MRLPADHERLLAEVLSDDAGFREALLAETVRLARRRRRFRRGRLATVALAALLCLAAFIWHSLPPRAVTREMGVDRCAIVRTQPLPSSALVSTQPQPSKRLIASIATAKVIETTADSGRFQEIGDDALLALAAPKPAVLVRLGPGREELVFANSDDKKGFPLD
ncbi:MAG TPA: hypothetical protein VMB80_12350 [Candidatus Acidoferrum sp.]|nr:hypothetical protein [Candidatus Acidoferrum sp.]